MRFRLNQRHRLCGTRYGLKVNIQRSQRTSRADPQLGGLDWSPEPSPRARKLDFSRLVINQFSYSIKAFTPRKSLGGDSWKYIRVDFQTKFLFSIFGFIFTYLLTLSRVMVERVSEEAGGAQ